MHEADAINNVRNSSGLVSEDTLLSNHPWVDDVEAEKKRMAAQRREESAMYGDDPNGDEEKQL